MAEGEFSVLRDLVSWDGRRRVQLTRDSGGYWEGVSAWVTVQICLQADDGWKELDVVDLEAYGKYCVPGSGW